MASDQSIEQQSRSASEEHIQEVQSRIDAARSAFMRAPKGPESQAQFEATIDAIFGAEFEKFSSEERNAISAHPAMSFLEEEIHASDVDEKIDAILFLGYMNSLPVSEGENNTFPGLTENGFQGLEDREFRAVNNAVQTFMNNAANDACAACTDENANALPNVMSFTPPEGLQTEKITVNKVKNDLESFTDEDGVRQIAEMRTQLAENDTINPYQFSLMSLSLRGTMSQVQAMTNFKFFNRDDFIESECESTFQGIACINEDISIAELAELNGLNPEETERLRDVIDEYMALGSVTTEARDLIDNDGFLKWALKAAGEHKDTFEESSWGEIAAQRDTIKDIVETAPGMNPSRAEHLVQNLGESIALFQRIEAVEKGLSLDDYRILKEHGEIAFLQRHNATERGQEMDTPDVFDPTAGNDPTTAQSVPDFSGDGYSFRIPIIEGIDVDGERISSSLYTNEDGDGFRLGALNVNGLNEPPSAELFFRQSYDDLGQFDLGYLGHNNGDFDGEIRTMRPYVGDHFENYDGILGMRFTGEELSLGGGELQPSATVGEYNGDFFANTGLTYDRDLTESLNLQTGGFYTYAEESSRLDGFGTLEYDFNGNDQSAVETLWRGGFQSTYWMDDDRLLGTGFTELEFTTTGDEWYSNLRNVFGAYANTDDLYGAYSEHTKRMDLGLLGRPDIGVRLEHNNEEDFQAGVVAGWSF